MPLRAFRLDPSAMDLGDPADHGKAQTGALAASGGVGPVKTIPDFRQFLLRNADAGVGYLDYGGGDGPMLLLVRLLLLRHAALPAFSVRYLCHFQGHLNPSSWPVVADGVG